MSLRHALLGELAAAPHSGYELLHRFDAALGYVWTASQGSIYPELVKLDREGLIETVRTGPRGRKVYAVTEDGLAELRRWLATAPVRQSKDELILRVFLLDQVAPEDALRYLEQLRDLYAERRREYEQRLAGAVVHDARERFSVIALRAGIAHETAMERWASEVADELATELETASLPAKRR